MNRLLRTVAASSATAAAVRRRPSRTRTRFTPLGLHLVVSATGLAVAIVLLFEALRLRKIALGGAIAEKLHFVMLAIVCLAASALAEVDQQLRHRRLRSSRRSSSASYS